VKSSAPPKLPRPLQRDRPDSSFSLILSRFLARHDHSLAAVLVDGDGECVDYATVLDPYEAKIFGAVLLSTSAELMACTRKLGHGAPIQWVVEAARYDLVVRRLSEDFTLVVVLEAERLTGHVLAAMSALAEALRREAGLSAETWDPASVPFRVDMQRTDGGEDVPACVHDGSRALRVERVLARWTERGGISHAERLCFRVRAGDRDLTLVYEPDLLRWHRR
jgi:predicted regulator of Ras-like GTPase activity (Roadblock/LC7/MglB family)